MLDVLVIGAGPAALSIAAELGGQGLAIAALAPCDPTAPWTNTYGIWADEVDSQGLAHLLSHRWSDTVSYFGPGGPNPGAPGPEGANPETPATSGSSSDGLVRHGRAYGLFDKSALQEHWLRRCEQTGVHWHQGHAVAILHETTTSSVSTTAGETFRARLVVDATGHEPVFVQRGSDGPVAGQAAYGIVGRFSADPIAPGQFVFMDYRSDHLSEAERQEPPTFLYAMDLGKGIFLWRKPPWPLPHRCPSPPFKPVCGSAWPIGAWRCGRCCMRSFASSP